MKVIPAPHRVPGGVHPRDHKGSTAAAPLQDLPTPSRLIVSMAQHLGAPAVPIVATGDAVKAGQRIGEAAGFISAHVHAPIAGAVKSVEAAMTPMGRPAPAVVIEPSDAREDASPALEPIDDWSRHPPRALVERVAEAGVVGMGGAGFPTRVKLSPPADKPIDTLIINGAECEPYLTGDHRLMLEHAEAVAEGCRILRHILGARTLRLAIEDNKPDAVKAMAAALKTLEGDVAVVVLDTRYPHGSEKQQIYALTGRTVPAGGLPMQVGAVVENVATTYAVWDAVRNGNPLAWRIVTVSGDAVRRPGNIFAPVGTSFADLVAACDGLSDNAARLIAGGPMMGFAQFSLDVPVTKTSSGLLALSPSQFAPFYSTPCIGCGRCLTACPMRLTPSALSQAIEAEAIEEAEALNVMDCFECGCCAYVCPAHRPLVQHMRRAKSAIMLQRKQESARS